MLKHAIAFAVVAAALIVFVRPASATITSASMTASPANYNGTCPVNINFTSSVQGTNGTSFKFDFVRHVNGAQTVVTGGTGVISGGSFKPPTDSIPISSSSTPSLNADQLWVHNISGGGSDVYSPYANFTVNCGPDPNTIPAPANAHGTTDPRECSAHLPATAAFFLVMLCPQVLQNHGEEFVFDWHGNGAFPDVDGFHVYNARSHQQINDMTSSAGGGVTVAFETAHIVSFHGPFCVTIRAYKGGKESADSNVACLGGNPVRTVMLNPTQVRSFAAQNNFNTGFLSGVLGGPFTVARDDGPNKVLVGYYHWYDKHFLGDDAVNSFARAGLLYDIASLHANFIYKAVLHLRITGGATDPDPRSSTFPANCISEVGLGTATWWTGNGNIDGDFSNAESPVGGPDITVDVARPVRNFIGGAPNLGFILRGSNEDLGAFTKSMCETEYAVPPQLEVTFN